MANALTSTITSDWRALARCKQPEFAHVNFYPNKGFVGVVVREAKQVCAGCPVRRQCLEDALERHEQFGIWGGLTLTERRSVNRQSRRKDTA